MLYQTEADLHKTVIEYRQPAQAERETLPKGFVYLDETLPGVLWDAKYATEDNFTGSVVDGYHANRIALSEGMLPALKAARDAAKEMGYTLLVWDAARPQRAVDRFVAWSEEPEDDRTKARHYPTLARRDLFPQGYVARRSGHSKGSAIDLTLADATGQPLDMGGDFDFMDEKSHHDAKGLSEAQTANRETLRRIMTDCGFKPYQNEWWHYSLASAAPTGEYYDFAIEPREASADGMNRFPI